MTTYVRAVRRPGVRTAWTGAVGLLALFLFAGATPVVAQTSPSWAYDHDVRLTYEFDDNVEEKLRNPVRAQVARVSYRGDFDWAGGDQRLSFVYLGGFKRHFGVVEDEPDLSSQFVNEGRISYVRRLTEDLALSARMGLKDRTWTDRFFLLNEDAFRRYSGEIGLTLNLDPVDPRKPARLEAGFRYSDIEFDHLDQAFGNWLVGAHVALAKRFDETLETRWSYSFDQVRYPGRGTLEPGDAPQGIFGPARERQEDHIHELGAEMEWFGEVGIVADYRFRFNDSNSFGFTHFSHNVGLQLLRELPWGMFAQAYGTVELRAFTEPVPSLEGGGSLDIGEAANNVMMLRLVKDVTPNSSLEVKYARYRNESLTLNDFFTKNIYAIGITYHP